MKTQSQWLFESPFPTRADYMAASGKSKTGKPSDTRSQGSAPKPDAESELIALENAPDKIRKMGWKRGIYVIFRGKERVYVGKANKTEHSELAIRIAQHRGCLTHLLIPIEDYKVKVFHFPNATNEQIHAAETAYRVRFPKKFSHQKNTE
jgi:hypothetical protein